MQRNFINLKTTLWSENCVELDIIHFGKISLAQKHGSSLLNRDETEPNNGLLKYHRSVFKEQ